MVSVVLSSVCWHASQRGMGHGPYTHGLQQPMVLRLTEKHDQCAEVDA